MEQGPTRPEPPEPPSPDAHQPPPSRPSGRIDGQELVALLLALLASGAQVLGTLQRHGALGWQDTLALLVVLAVLSVFARDLIGRLRRPSRSRGGSG